MLPPDTIQGPLADLGPLTLRVALDTVLATPTGWTTMGEIAVGDLLHDAEGQPTRVVAATEVMVGRPCYELTFSDGSVIVADAEHQWLTRPLAVPGPAPQDGGIPLPPGGSEVPLCRTTRELAGSLDKIHTIAMPDGSVVKVEAVVAVDSVPVRCVQVDNDAHMYLAGASMIPTHNSTLALDFCQAASIHNNLNLALPAPMWV